MQLMQINSSRFQSAFKAMTVHLGLSLLVAAAVALLVFTFWFPYPYRELAGGSELFILVMAVDIVCGPLLTFVLFSPTKPKKELITDISLIVVIQLIALVYGIWNVWLVRTMYLVQEVDKFNIISWSNLDTRNVNALPSELKPQLFSGPVKVSLREMTKDEQEKMNLATKAGDYDRSEQPSFYTVYDGEKAHKHGRPLRDLLLFRPSLKERIDEVIKSNPQNDDFKQLRYLYIVGRQYWIAIINSSGTIIGYVEIK